ncbi:zinc-ribbon domain-containing protein [Pseudomonas aeruginosa]|uniref:zinc ribbon domain-containing protein n=1 Tax=Pseudomonas aeruginosa TaxID=287 RepID=UPI003B587699
MALIKCKECGAQVSNKAKACPSCGAKVPKSVGVIGWLFVILIVLPIAWQFGTGIGSSGDAAQSRPSSPQSAATSPTKSPWVRIPRHLDTQPTIIWTLIPRSLGQAVGAQRRRFALLV